MSKQFLLGVLAGAVFVCALWALLDTPTSLRASGNAVKPTPTISKRMNARFLENYRAKDFMPTTEASQFLAGRFYSGVAKAGVYGLCNNVMPTVIRSFDNVSDEPVEIEWIADGVCRLRFGFLVTDRFVSATSSDGVINVWQQANIVDITLRHLDGTPAEQYFTLLVH